VKRIKGLDRRISAGEIIEYLFYLNGESHEENSSERSLKVGEWLHQKLGYNQTEIFKRYYQYQGENWLVGGCPDKIDEQNGMIEELKTYQNHDKKTFYWKLAEVRQTYIVG